MSVQKSLALALCLSLAAACGKNNGNSDGGTDGGANAYGLTVVAGGSVLTMHPGDKKNLRVVLAQANVGPVPNAAIQFAFDNENNAAAQIDTPNATTGMDGVASFNLTAGGVSTFKVIASAPDYPDVRPVAFSIQVVTVRKLLQIVGNPQVQVNNAGDAATVTMYKSSSVGLKVQLLDQDTGLAIAGDNIAFSLGSQYANSIDFSGGSSNTSASVTTGTAGTAQVFLVSTTIIQSNMLVTALDASGGVQGVNFAVTVQDNTSGGTCTSNSQCPAGETCVGGACTTVSGGTSCTAGNDNGCPFGYVCTNGTCQAPANPSCDPNNPTATCPTGDTCVCTGSPGAQTCQCEPICGNCPAGTTCVITGTTGTCEPAAGQTPDLTGVWYTRHSFSIQQALPSWVQTIQGVVRDMDQLIQGDFFSGFWSFLNPIVSGIIDQYVPDWVQTLIEVLDDVGTIFSNLRSIGSMKITQGSMPALVNGTEVWTSFVFYWLPLCNGNIGGNNYTPDCARFDVATTDGDQSGNGTCQGQALPSISVQIAPFSGQVAQDSTTMNWVFHVTSREVDLKMGKLVLVALNLLISYLTPYDCIEDALTCTPGNACLIDCPDLGQDISDVSDGLLSPSDGEAICDGVANAAGQLLTNWLATVSFSADTLDFGGHAIIAADGSADGDCSGGNGGPCASKLGNDNYDNDLQSKDGKQDGFWSGNFFFNVVGCNPGDTGSGCMPGAWEAERDPVQ